MSVILRASARRDVDRAVVRYLEEGGPDVALGFIDALETALGHVARNPGSGSPRHGQELNLAGLRSWPLATYPYLIFYMEGEGVVDVWRILHGRRDIPESLQEGDRPAPSTKP
ncbi:type II toxin-antitoxin system RelE/ParE family toxin [Candidatus Palauibacter irciniicola]|uniref:type II toxin-antitoxin system RelE/ParE family toxin n=1 Tax=Candidatus Palauibacter irciniicola TaxID=3056733 RepID=UPI003B0188BF